MFIRTLHLYGPRYLLLTQVQRTIELKSSSFDRVARVHEDVLFSDTNYLEFVSQKFRKIRRTQFLSSIQHFPTSRFSFVIEKSAVIAPLTVSHEYKAIPGSIYGHFLPSVLPGYSRRVYILPSVEVLIAILIVMRVSSPLIDMCSTFSSDISPNRNPRCIPRTRMECSSMSHKFAEFLLSDPEHFSVTADNFHSYWTC